jgi:hypothetical protein
MWNGLVLNRGLRGDRPVTNRLSQGTTLKIVKLQSISLIRHLVELFLTIQKLKKYMTYLEDWIYEVLRCFSVYINRGNKPDKCIFATKYSK